MFSYTTCRDCQGLLHVATHGQTVCDGCIPRPTRVEELTEAWLKAVEDEDTAAEIQYAEQIVAIEQAPPRLLDAALIYASWGWAVFPLAPQAKQPCIPSPHGHGSPERATCHGECDKWGHGLHDASINVNHIREWWGRYPQANIGLPTGHLFDVVDIDPRHGGNESLRKIMDAEDGNGVGAIPDTHGRVSTGGGGQHYYIEPTGDPNGANLMPGIDFRGLGGYVVAPPSWLGHHEARWTWTVKPSPRIRK